MTTKRHNIFEKSKIKQLVNFFNTYDDEFDEPLDIQTIMGRYSLFISEKKMSMIDDDLEHVKYDLYLRLDLNDDQLDYQIATAILPIHDDIIDMSHVRRTVKEMSDNTLDSDVLTKEIIDYLVEQLDDMKSMVKQLYSTHIQVEPNIRMIDNYMRRHTEFLAHYFQLDEKLENMLPVEYLTPLVEERYGERIKREIDIELQHYTDPEGDLESKRKWFYEGYVSWVAGNIILGVNDIKRVISDKRHKIFNEMLTNDPRYLENASKETIELACNMIKSNSPIQEVVQLFDFDTDDISFLINIMKDQSFAERFDEFYNKFIEDEFYQSFLYHVREMGLVRK